MSHASPSPPPRLLRRLRKVVAASLGIPLQDVDAHFDAQRITVITPESDTPARVPLETLIFDEDRPLFDGAPLPPDPPLAYALLNKPKHVTSTTRDPKDKQNLAPYLRAMPPGCFPVGRLDRETTGLLLFSNDGDLASAILRPDHQTTKTYWLWLDDELTEDDPRLAQFITGLAHNGHHLSARGARIIVCNEGFTELELTLTQGKKRQIRIMCRAMGLHLQHLHRTRIGPLSDPTLPLGSWRPLTPLEVEALWQAAGGRPEIYRRQLAALTERAVALRAAGTAHVRLEHWLATHSP